MALPSLYDEITFHNNTTPALNEDNLNAMSHALKQVDDRVIGLAGTIMEDVPQIQEALGILEPAIENIDSNVERAETAADDAEDSAETAEYWANVSNPPIPVVKDFASVISVDDAIPKAATDVKAKIEAVQDLHGYTKPWVGGAGKNKMPYIESRTGYGGLDFTLNSDGSVRVKGTPGANDVQLGTSDFELPAGTYILSTGLGTVPSTGQVQIRVGKGTGGATLIGHADKANNVTFTLTETTTIRCGYRIQNLSGTSIDVTYHGMLRLSGTSDTYEQYENICPISGFTEAKLTRTGKNLLDSSSGVLRQYTSDPTALRWGYNPILLNAGTYTISYTKNTNYDLYLVYTDTWESLDLSASGTTFTLSSKREVFIRSALSSGSTEATFLSHFSNVQLEIGNHATTYEPYNGTDYIINLGGTRYGATLDVTSGVMTVNKGYKDLGDLTYTKDNNNAFYATLSDAVTGVTGTTMNAICSQYHVVETKGSIAQILAQGDGIFAMQSGSKLLFIKDTSKSSMTTTEFKTAMSGVQLVYELATPITVQLTPTEVQMLQGYNLLSANSGDVYLKYDASMIQRIANEKLDITTFKSVVASSSDFADFKTKVAAL